jgi:hypothetical protein
VDHFHVCGSPDYDHAVIRPAQDMFLSRSDTRNRCRVLASQLATRFLRSQIEHLYYFLCARDSKQITLGGAA